MEYKHGRCNRPTVEDFAVASDAFVRQEAVWALLYPVDGILAATGPKEAHADAEQCFVDAEMAANWTAMEDIED